jgi:hypothetical protein
MDADVRQVPREEGVGMSSATKIELALLVIVVGSVLLYRFLNEAKEMWEKEHGVSDG